MKTEREKMVAGELYRPSDPELVAARLRARSLTYAFNQSQPGERDRRDRIMRELFAAIGTSFEIEPVF